MKTTLGRGGRLVIPARFRKALALREGDEVVLTLSGDALEVSTPRQALERAQRMVRRYVPQSRSLARELIRQRRQDARGE